MSALAISNDRYGVVVVPTSSNQTDNTPDMPEDLDGGTSPVQASTALPITSLSAPVYMPPPTPVVVVSSQPTVTIAESLTSASHDGTLCLGLAGSALGVAIVAAAFYLWTWRSARVLGRTLSKEKLPAGEWIPAATSTDVGGQTVMDHSHKGVAPSSEIRRDGSLRVESIVPRRQSITGRVNALEGHVGCLEGQVEYCLERQIEHDRTLEGDPPAYSIPEGNEFLTP